MKQIIQSGHELTDAGLVSRETGEVKDTVSFVVESGSYVVTPEQQEQRRKAREERIKKAMLRNGKKAEKFVFVDANINFEGVSPAMVTRLLYLSTYAGYKDEMGKDCPKDLGNPIIRNDSHVLFVDVPGIEHRESGSTSFTNKAEADTINVLLQMIDNSCNLDANGKRFGSNKGRGEDTRLSVGVICAYADQARAIRKVKRRYQSFNHSSDCPFMVKTVDDFQGDERDIIILSMVRTRKSGFLEDYRRINVAISRARRLLIIVGNRRNLESMKVNIDGRPTPVYRDIIRKIDRKNGLLRQSDIVGGE